MHVGETKVGLLELMIFLASYAGANELSVFLRIQHTAAVHIYRNPKIPQKTTFTPPLPPSQQTQNTKLPKIHNRINCFELKCMNLSGPSTVMYNISSM